MYATIRRGERGTVSTDELARAGHALAVRLGAAPGFVACLVVELLDGGYAAVCLCEDRASLVAADELVAGWDPAGDLTIRTATPQHFTGEVVAQKGL